VTEGAGKRAATASLYGACWCADALGDSIVAGGGIGKLSTAAGVGGGWLVSVLVGAGALVAGGTTGLQGGSGTEVHAISVNSVSERSKRSKGKAKLRV
jgi:hypothetical protein